MTVQFYVILSSIIDLQLAAEGITDSKATTIKDGLLEGIRKNLAGHSVHFKTQHKSVSKHKAICDEFTGSNHRELMAKYEIGYAWLVKILRRGGVSDEETF